MKKLLAFYAPFIVLLAVAAITVGDEVRTGTGTTTGALPAGAVDPYPPATQVPFLICFNTSIQGGGTAYRVNIGASVASGPVYSTALGVNAFHLQPVVLDPSTWTQGDPDTWIYRCMTSGGAVDISAPPGGDVYGQVACNFGCADLGNFNLEIWATNSVGSDFCNPGIIEVDDPNGLCGP